MKNSTPRLWATPVFAAVLALLAPDVALAQRVPASDLMPPPKAAPRTPVKSVKLTEPAPRELKGQATAQDGGTIHLQTFDGKGYDLRLAGLVIAPLSDPKGIAARVALDNLLEARTLNCIRRDRDTDGKLLVTCSRDDSIDLTMQMLRDGVTLFTRNGNLSDEFTAAYRTAEAQAQSARRGLWATVPAIPASSAAKAKTITPVIIEGDVAAPVVNTNVQPVTVTEKPAMEVAPQAPATQTAAPVATPVTVPVATAETKPATNAMQITQTPATMAAPTVPAAPAYGAPTVENGWMTVAMPTPEGVTDTMGFFFAASLIGTLLLGISLFDFLGRRRVRYAQEWEARHNRQIVAAALGGELAAARDVCEARAHSVANGAPANWPRLRSYVYQTHVDKIGMLGPFLARQIATIYGQMADYGHASKEQTDQMGRDAMVKSLNRLCGYVDVALEGLAEVEVTGELPLPVIPVEYQGPAEQRRIVEASQRSHYQQQAIAHKPAAAQPQQPAYGAQHAQRQQPQQRPAPTPVAAAKPAPAARPAQRAPKESYPTYGEIAAQKIMEDEIIRARAEELLKAKASPMKRRTAVKTAPAAQREYTDTHHADLLGLEEDAAEQLVERPAHRAKAKG